MKFYDGGFFIFLAIITACVVGGYLSIYYLGDDNLVEETAEAVIKKETGIDMDLSPKTPEITL